MSLLLSLLLIIPAILGGVVLHELVHYLAVWPMAEDVRLLLERGPTRLAVEYDYLDEDWRHRWGDVAAIAPLLIGLTTMIATWLTIGLPAFDAKNGWMFAGWLVFTVGGPADFVRTFV